MRPDSANASLQTLRRFSIIASSSVCIGSAVALFLWLLQTAIDTRFHYPWLLYLLPLAGLAIHFIYRTIGKSSEKGNNLIIDEIHEPGAGVPPQMAPVILITTVITHLFGGSAGREGTAVQIGGGIAERFATLFKLKAEERKTLLTAGVAAGFGAVFGTPIAGAVFAIEVLTVGKLRYKDFIPCLIAAFFGHFVVLLWGIKHTAYRIDLPESQSFAGFILHDLRLIPKVILASAAFGLMSSVFSISVHGTKKFFLQLLPQTWLIPLIGGCLIIALTFILGKPDYLSLGVDPQYPGSVTIQSAFQSGGANNFSWLWKTVYTVLTLGTDFKGGEVTPLFYIGATLGNTVAGILSAPVSLFAALGFVAVFAGATKTPIACAVMACELFGPEHAFLFSASCFVAFLCSGRKGIYRSQRRNSETRF